MDKKNNKNKDKQTEKQKETNSQTASQTQPVRHTASQTDRQTDRNPESQSASQIQTESQPHRQTDKQREECAHLIFGPVPGRVTVSGSLQMSKLNLVRSVHGANIHRKLHLQELTILVPVHLKKMKNRLRL